MTSSRNLLMTLHLKACGAYTVVPVGLPKKHIHSWHFLCNCCILLPCQKTRSETNHHTSEMLQQMFSHTSSLSHPGLSHYLVRASNTHQVNEVTEILLYLLRRQTPHQIQGTIQLLVTLRKQEHTLVTICTGNTSHLHTHKLQRSLTPLIQEIQFLVLSSSMFCINTNISITFSTIWLWIIDPVLQKVF